MQTGCLTSQQQQHRNNHHHYSMFIPPSNGPNSPNCVLTRPREQCPPSAHNHANYHPILSELLQGGSYDGTPAPPPQLTHKNNIQFVPLNLFKVEQLVPPRIFSPNAYPIRFHWNLVASPLANGCRILLRFCKLSVDKNRQVDQLPDSFFLSINSRTVSIKPRKYSHPFDITELFDSCRGCEITLRVAPDLCSPECTVDFYFGLFLAKKVDIEQALAKFKATKPQPSEVTLNLIRRSLCRDDDDDGDVEVEVSNHFVRVSLLCSYSFTRMSLPVRSIKCEHIGCFDGVAFFTVNNNRSHPRWQCPICQIAIQLDELVIDGLFMTLLGAIPADCTDANLYPDGKFEYCKQNRQTILGKQDRCSCAHCTRLGGLLVASRKRKAEWITIED